jgi:hypothetical protein
MSGAIPPSPPRVFIKHRGVAVTELWRLTADYLPRRPGIDLRSNHMGFVAENVALLQVSFEYFSFPC